MTPEQIKAYIAALEKGMSDNVLSIEFEGKKQTFENAAGIQARLDYFHKKLRDTSPGRKSKGPRRTTVYTTGVKGL